MCEMRLCLTAGPCAVRFVSLQMCVCTVNGTVVGGHSKWEAGENRLERVEAGARGERGTDGQKEKGQSAEDEGARGVPQCCQGTYFY